MKGQTENGCEFDKRPLISKLTDMQWVHRFYEMEQKLLDTIHGETLKRVRSFPSELLRSSDANE